MKKLPEIIFVSYKVARFFDLFHPLIRNFISREQALNVAFNYSFERGAFVCVDEVLRNDRGDIISRRTIKTFRNESTSPNS